MIFPQSFFFTGISSECISPLRVNNNNGDAVRAPTLHAGCHVKFNVSFVTTLNSSRDLRIQSPPGSKSGTLLDDVSDPPTRTLALRLRVHP